jgi:release factor glutamine methyltransferase
MTREKELGPGDLGPPWTALKLLRWTTGYFDEQGVTETPRLDADLLLGHVLDLDRVELYARTDTVVEEKHRKAFRQLVKRRAAGEPVAYLVGHREFWQMDLAVDDRTIIPRPETEVAVEVALEVLGARDVQHRIADIGTGTGAIALALANEMPAARIAATENNRETLQLARTNVQDQEMSDRVELFEGDLMEALPEEWAPLDLIVSNPPYVPESDRDEVTIEVREHEPDEALFAGPDGLAVLERLVPEAAQWLDEEGWLVVEIGHDQGEAVRELFEEAGLGEVQVRKDYADNDRVAYGKAKG